MSSKRGRSRSSGAVSDKRSKDRKDSPGKSEPESEKPELPLEYEYETEDGLRISLSPDEAEISREYQLSENDFVEFSAGIEISPLDWKIEKTGDDASVSGEVSLPGDILGLSGGVSVDLSTGEIIGGELGVELGGAGVEVSVSGEGGCQKSLEVSLFGVGVTYTRDDCEPDENRRNKGNKTELYDDDEDSKWREDIDKVRESVKIYGECHTTHYLGVTVKIENVLIDGKVEQVGTASSGISLPLSEHGDGGFYYWGGYSIGFAYSEDVYSWMSHLESPPTEPGAVHSIVSFSKPIDLENTSFLRSLLSGPVPWSYAGTTVSYCRNEIVDAYRIEFGPRTPPSPPPRRIMNDCCRDSMKLMREIHTHLGIPELRDKGVKFPNRLMASGARGYTKVDTILDLMELMIREIDHLGIHPHEITIKDVDPGTPGDQKISAEFVNATGWAKALMENSLKSDGEADARLNIQVRLARLLLETFVTAVSGKYKTDAIATFLGVTTQEDVVRPPVPFDVTLGMRQVKGFGTQPTDKDKIKKLSQKKVIELLDRFLAETKQDVVIEKFAQGEQSLLELLQQLVQQT